MKPAGLANTRISTGYAQKSPRSLSLNKLISSGCRSFFPKKSAQLLYIGPANKAIMLEMSVQGPIQGRSTFFIKTWNLANTFARLTAGWWLNWRGAN